MNEVQKKPNDWLVATVSNPDLGLANFAEAGLNAENTQLKDRNFYKNSQFVQDTFKTDDGKFDEVKFNKAYDDALTQYEAFSNDSFDKSYLDQLSASFTNSFRSPSSSIRSESLKTAKVENPFRELKGLHGFGSIQESHLSLSEIAQQNKVFDYDSNKFLDWSPNDKSGLTSFFRDPLVLAQWDEDGTHVDNNGRTIRHKKGDLKYNEDGDVYYETLGKRDASKRQFLSSFDTLTIDGSMANKFDIFDTDDKEQNIGKAVARMGLKWAPLLLAGIASGGTSTVAAAAIGFNKVYLGTTALLNLTEAMPMLYKSIEGILTNNEDMDKRSGLWNVMNTIQSKTASAKLGTSEYSKNKTFTWENTINMMSDVMLQLGQQRFIAEIPKHLGLEKRFIESAMMAGKNPYEGVKKFNDFSSALATYYMTVTSGADAYNTAIEAGNSERTAGLLTLGTLVGLHQIMKSDVGQWGLKGIGLDDLRVTLKPILREEAAKAAEGHMIQKGLETTVKGNQSKILNFIQGIGNKVSNRIKGFIENPSTFIGAMVNESIEEVSEEMTQDAVFGLGKAAEALGITRKSNWDWFETDIINRYAMSAFGGAVGGGMHHVNWNAFRGVVSSLDEKTKKDIIYATYKYGSAEVNKMIDKMYKNDELAGSKTLGVNPEKDAQGKTHFIETSSEESSQAYIIKEQLKNTVNTIEQLLSQTGSNGLELDARRALNIEGDEGLKRLAGLGLTSAIASDLLSINTEILDLTLKVKDLEGPDGTGNGGEYRARLNELMTEKNWILSGERFDDYFQYGLLYLNPELASKFTIANKNDMSEKLLGKEYESLSKFEQEIIDNKYKNYQEKQGQQLKYAVKILNITNEKIDPNIVAYSQDYKNTRKATHSQLRNHIENQLEALKIINHETGELDAQKLADTKGMPIVGTPLLVDPSLPISEILTAISSFKQSGFPMDEEIAKVFRKAVNEIKNITKVNFDKNISDQLDEIIPITGDSIISLNNMPVIKQLFSSSFDITEFDASKLIEEIDELSVDDLFSQIKEDVVRDVNIVEYDEEGDQISNEPYFKSESREDLAEDFKKYLKERVRGIKDILESSYANEITGIQSISSELNNTVKNPVFGYLNEVSKLTGSNTDGLFKTLADEELRLNQKELTDYIVSDGNNLQILQKAVQDIEIAKILTNQRIQQDGYQSYGSILNTYRQKYASKNPLLSTIDMETAMIISADLDQLKQQIQFFIDLSLYNSADKLREHKKIGAKFMVNFAKLFVEGDPNAILQQVKTKLGFNLLEGIDEVITNDFDGYNALTDSLSKLVSSGATISDDIANKAEVILTRMEDKIYENFQKHLAANPNINLTDLFKTLYKDVFLLEKNNSDSIVEGVTSDLSSLPDKKLTDFDKMMYISTIMSSKLSDFKTILKQHIENLPVDSQIAPIFGQEYPARMAFGMISNPAIFNASLNSLQDDKGDLFYPMVQNLLFINGYPGTGKTSATAGLIHSVVKAVGKDFTITSILDRQVETLKESLGENGKGMNRHELLGSILKGKSISDVVDSNAGYKSKNFIKEEELDKLTDNLEIGQVIYIDEVTHYTNEELLVIGRWANKTGRVLITFGDTLQNGAKFDIQYLSAARSPVLEYSMRAGAVIVRDNNDVFRVITKKLNDYELTRKDDEGNHLRGDDAILNAQENKLADLTEKSVVKYYESSNGLVTGIKLLNQANSTKSDLSGYIQSIIASGTKNVGIIYDNERQADYQDLKDLSEQYGISMMAKDKMQGAEFDYVILSCDLSKKSNPLVYAKLLNTLFSRAKLGIIAKENGLGIKNVKSNYNDRQFIPEDVLSKFKENRLIPLSEIASTNTKFKIAEAPKVEGGKKTHTEPPQNPSTIKTIATDQIMSEILGISNFESDYQTVDSDYEYGPNGEKLNPGKIADDIGMMQTGYKTFGGKFKDGKYILPTSRSGEIGKKMLFDLQAFASAVDNKNNIITEVSGIDSEINASLLQDYDLFTNTLFNGMLEGKSAKEVIENMEYNLFVNNDNELLDVYDWTNAKLKFLYTKADKNFDENYEVGGGSDTSYLDGGKIIKRLVIWADNVIDGDRAAVLTVGSVMAKDAGDQVSKVDKAAKEEVKKSGFATRIISHEAFAQSGSYTRIERKNAVDFSLSSFLNEDPRWKTISKPMIFTGRAPLNLDPDLLDTDSENYKEKLEKFLYSSSLNGRAFAFVTYDPEFKNKTDKDLAEYFFNQRIERIQRREALKNNQIVNDRKYPGKITMIMLDPKSIPVDEFFSKFRAGIEEIKQGKTKALNSISNRYLGLNILKSVYELNQYLHSKGNKNLSDREKAIKANTWTILKMVESEFHLKCTTVKNSQNEDTTEVVLLDGNLKNPKPLDLSENLLEKALAVKSDTKNQYRSKLYDKYYKKIENLIDGKGFTDLLLYFSDITNPANAAIEKSVKADYFAQTLEIAMTGKIGKGEIDKDRKGQFKPRFPEGIYSHPIYLGDKNSNNITDWMEASANKLSEFEVSGVRVEARRYKIAHSSYFVFTEENYNNDQKKKAQELVNTKNQIVDEFKKAGTSLKVIDAIETIVKNKDKIDKEELATEINNKLQGLSIQAINPADSKDPIVTMTVEDNLSVTVETLSGFKVLENINIGSVEIKENDIKILTVEGDSKLFRERSIYDLESPSKEAINKTVEESAKLTEDINKYITSLSNKNVLQDIVLKLFNGNTLSFKDIKAVSSQLKEDKTFMKLLERKLDLEC